MRIPTPQPRYYPWLLALGGILLWVPGLGLYPLFDWDTINFAECAREMLETGDYLRVQMAYRPFYEKPPLYFWLQALCMGIFGVNDFAAQLPNALAGVATLLVLYRAGSQHFGPRFGLLWAGAYGGSLLPAFYFRHGFIDPIFNLFIFLAIWQLMLYHWKWSGLLDRQPNGTNSRPAQPGTAAYLWKRLGLVALFTGLAVLAKGPVGLGLVGVVAAVYWAWGRFRWWINPLHAVVAVVGAVAVAGVWFGVEALVNGPRFSQEFFTYVIRLAETEDAGHAGFPGYHFVVLMVGCFPASFLMMPAMRRNSAPDDRLRNLRLWMLILLGVVLVVFSLVKTKIVHYSSLGYFPISFLAAYAIEEVWRGRLNWSRQMLRLMLATGLLLAAAMTALPLLGMFAPSLTDFVGDKFARLNLPLPAGWAWWQALPGLAFAGAIMVGWRYVWRGRLRLASIWLFGSTALATTLAALALAPGILTYSQDAAIQFYTEHQHERAYFHTLNFKSYAPYYYARMAPPTDSAFYAAPDGGDWLRTGLREYLLNGPVDRPVYFTAKMPGHDAWLQDPRLELMETRGGFAFFRRKITVAPQP